MLIDRHKQMNLFDSILPTTAVQMDPELQQVDQLLDNDGLFQSVKNDLSRRHPQTLRRGRHSTPVEVVLRMLLLKHLYCWSYERTEHFVKDSLSLRQFCRIYLEKVPDDTVLIRWAQLISDETLLALHEHIVHEARRHKLTRGKKLRIDTTVVETNIHYPTDSTLLQDSVRTLTRITSTVRDIVARHGERLRDFTRSAKRRVLHIIKFTKGRTDEAAKSTTRAYRQLCEITRRTVTQTERIKTHLQNDKSPAAKRFIDKCNQLLPTVEKVIDQTRRRIIHQEQVPSQDKVVSICEPHSQIHRRGKRTRPTEFGHLVKIQETDGGIISDVQILFHPTADVALLKPSIEKHIGTFGRPPTHLAADRGFSSVDNELTATSLGVTYVALPAKGNLSKDRRAHEHQRWFKKLHRFRVGIEARISLLKRRYGLSRCLYKGQIGFTRWVFLGVVASNVLHIARRMIT